MKYRTNLPKQCLTFIESVQNTVSELSFDPFHEEHEDLVQKGQKTSSNSIEDVLQKITEKGWFANTTKLSFNHIKDLSSLKLLQKFKSLKSLSITFCENLTEEQQFPLVNY